MEYRVIESSTQDTIGMLCRGKGSGASETMDCPDAIGLTQGRVIEMVYAADVAEKAAGVTVEDIRGNCPRSMILLAIFDDTASAEAALDEVRKKEKKGEKEWQLQD